MTAAIAIRDETRDALQMLVYRVNTTQDTVEASLSDVIDALLQVTRDLTGAEEMLEEIVYVARKN